MLLAPLELAAKAFLPELRELPLHVSPHLRRQLVLPLPHQHVPLQGVPAPRPLSQRLPRRLQFSSLLPQPLLQRPALPRKVRLGLPVGLALDLRLPFEHLAAELEVPLARALRVKPLHLHVLAECLVATHGVRQGLVRFADLLAQGVRGGHEPVPLALGLRQARLQLQGAAARRLHRGLQRRRVLRKAGKPLVQRRPLRPSSSSLRLAGYPHGLNSRLQVRHLAIALGNQLVQLAGQLLVPRPPALALAAPDLSLGPQLHLEVVLRIPQPGQLILQLLRSGPDLLHQRPLELLHARAYGLGEVLDLCLQLAVHRLDRARLGRHSLGAAKALVELGRQLFRRPAKILLTSALLVLKAPLRLSRPAAPLQAEGVLEVLEALHISQPVGGEVAQLLSLPLHLLN
mmetsp:Transcript_38306/g.110663  ORF Transcript_38306/g.110663 Transcript_38306/m.110663 type:complete len:401 (+) Transcript_38306:1179-2381(+)